MQNVREIQRALEHLPSQQKWEIAQWLLDELDRSTGKEGETPTSSPPSHHVQQPDYAARRQSIFGNKVLPNFVLTARGQERW